MMASIGGAGALERVIWGTGAVAFHPQPLLESFVRDFAFTDAVMERAGIAQITAEDKRNILFDNYARMSGLDLHARLARAGGDEFATRKTAGLAGPFSTCRGRECRRRGGGGARQRRAHTS